MAPDQPYDGTCPQCNSGVYEQWRYCPHCQESLYIACPECGEDAVFCWGICPSCGVNVVRTGEKETIDIEGFPCPVCGKFNVGNVGTCVYCGTQLMWLEGIPYKNTEYPALSEQIPQRISEASECPSCGDFLRTTWKACPRCGKSFPS